MLRNTHETVIMCWDLIHQTFFCVCVNAFQYLQQKTNYRWKKNCFPLCTYIHADGEQCMR